MTKSVQTSQSVQTTMQYSFGEITVKLGVNGRVNKPTLVLDHALTTVQTVIGIEVVDHGISEMRNNGKTEESCSMKVNAGEIELNIEVSFDINGQVPKRTLNDILFGAVLPRVLETASVYFGDNQPLTTPPAPLPQRSRRQVHDSIEEPLALRSPDGSTAASSATNGQRQRQPQPAQ